MKIIALLLIISLGYGLSAQKRMFIQVYDLAGEKINKGRIVTITDSSLSLRRNSSLFEIPISNIGSIRTKRSAGNNILTGAIIGATAGVIFGVASADPDAGFLAYSAGEGAAVFGSAGLIPGAAIGALTILFKNSQSYLINGDLIKWKTMQSELLPLKEKKKLSR